MPRMQFTTPNINMLCLANVMSRFHRDVDSVKVYMTIINKANTRRNSPYFDILGSILINKLVHGPKPSPYNPIAKYQLTRYSNTTANRHFSLLSGDSLSIFSFKGFIHMKL